MNKTALFSIFALGFACSVGWAADTRKAIAVLHPTSGNNVSGTVTFTASGNEVKVIADVTGLTPGKHGFHVHEKEDDLKTQPPGNTGGRVACGVIGVAKP